MSVAKTSKSKKLITIPTETFIETTPIDINKKIDNEVKDEIKELKTNLMSSSNINNESLSLLLNLYSKLSKKYKKLKIKKDNLEKIVKNQYAHTKLIGKTVDIIANSACSFEILAGRAGAFLPHKITILCKRKSEEPGILDTKCSVSICSVMVMGCPQLVSFDGSTVYGNTFDSAFFENGKIIDWNVFGNSAGQGLQIDIRNFNNFLVAVSVIIEGDHHDCSAIGLPR